MNREAQQLVVGNIGIAFKVLAYLNIRPGPSWEDAKGEAMLALCLAAETFDPSKAKFSTWAWWKVSGKMKDWLDRENRSARVAPDGVHSTRPIDVDRALDLRRLVRLQKKQALHLQQSTGEFFGQI